MKTVHLFAGCILGFFLAVSIIFLIFCTFLCGKVLFAVLVSPSYSFQLMKAYPSMFWPIFRIFIVEVLLFISTFLLIKSYRRYMRGAEDENNEINDKKTDDNFWKEENH